MDKNCRRRQRRWISGPLPEELPGISVYALYFQKLKSLSYIFAADNGPNFIQIFAVGPKGASFLQ